MIISFPPDFFSFFVCLFAVVATFSSRSFLEYQSTTSSTPLKADSSALVINPSMVVSSENLNIQSGAGVGSAVTDEEREQ